MSTAFWNSKEGKGSWEARDAWRAEAESCQLDSGSSVFPIKHLRISEAVITSLTEGGSWQHGYIRSGAN